MLAENEITTIQNYFSTQPVIRAFLFGSFARNEELPESDIDILVEIDQKEKIGLVKFISMQIDLEEIFRKKVDLLEEGGVSPYIKASIDREKKLIYEKRSGR
jgi:predicted nucleotidyltransferase